MISLPIVPVRFCPSKETLAVLNERQWICSYSGGKDSTSLVTWIEWLRRVGMVRCETPRLVMSDTTVEYPFLQGIADHVMECLTRSGWQCDVVTPPVHQRLYCRIFGVGNVPVHPAAQKMRWCTWQTKIFPMRGFAKTVGDDIVQLSGIRWGESDTRDGKLKASGCAAGGECGLPEPGDGVYSPIITWKTCKVLEWLKGETEPEIDTLITDLRPLMLELIEAYDLKTGPQGLFDIPPKVTALRFGCVGCPAVQKDRVLASKHQAGNPKLAVLRQLYGIWEALYQQRNRCIHVKNGKTKYGPVRMEIRKHYFAKLLDIQEKSGVTLVTAEDIVFIHDCWARKVYPRGWSEADEATVEPETGLFAERD